MLIACYMNDLNEARCVASMLRFGDFACEVFPCSTSMIRACQHRDFDLIILDANLQAEVQRSVMKWVQCRSIAAKVLLLSNEIRQEAIASALASGVDDLMVRPYSARELIIRVHITVQRACYPREGLDVIELAGIRLQRSSSGAWTDGERIELTCREFLLAWVFFSSPGVLHPRETLAVSVWGAHCDIAARTIEQHVYMLRKKLQMGLERGVWIRTAYGRGYRLEIAESPPAIDAGDFSPALRDAAFAAAQVQRNFRHDSGLVGS